MVVQVERGSNSSVYATDMHQSLAGNGTRVYSRSGKSSGYHLLLVVQTLPWLRPCPLCSRGGPAGNHLVLNHIQEGKRNAKTMI